MYILQPLLTVLSFLTCSIMALPNQEVSRTSLDRRAVTPARYVFAHFMVGIVSNRRSAADWDADMQRAKAYGIDAFALNIGTDTFTDTQLGYAYQSAANNGMKVFISFDFAYWSTGNPTAVGQKVAQYADLPGQFKVDNKVFVSTFVGDGVNVAGIRSAAGGRALYFVPNFSPYINADFSALDGAFNWMGWPNNGNNRAPAPSQTGTVEAGDQRYISALKGKDYMAPASPWFFTHYGPEVSYSKNWLFPGDRLWFDRWKQLLTLGPRFIEIVSWNDFGESHYVGPLSSTHYDDGASKWVNDMPHDGWLDMAKPFIAAYKAGATTVDNYITSDQIIYWYRPQLKSASCDSTDNCGTKPDGWNTVDDRVYVVTLLKSAASIRITSGNMGATINVNAGASIFPFPMGVGAQKFTLTRNGQTILDGTSLKNVIDGCVCGLYNFNAYVGVLPTTSSLPPSLDSNGLSRFSSGLKVTTCAARPSLSATPTSSTTTAAISSRAVSTTTTTTSASATPGTCNFGTGPGDYKDICSFSCYYGYCPIGPCSCTGYGTPKTPPASNGSRGVPADGRDSSYAGLCGFACPRGYCPSSICKTV